MSPGLVGTRRARQVKERYAAMTAPPPELIRPEYLAEARGARVGGGRPMPSITGQPLIGELESGMIALVWTPVLMEMLGERGVRPLPADE